MRMKRSIIVAVMAAVLCTLLAGAVVAAPGGKGKGNGGKRSTSGGTIDELVLLSSTDGLAHFGHRVTFKVTTTATDYPWVRLKCSQGGVVVYNHANGIFETSLNQIFTLGPTRSWTGGEADCVAELQDWDSYSKNGNTTTLATMTFHVYA